MEPRPPVRTPQPRKAVPLAPPPPAPEPPIVVRSAGYAGREKVLGVFDPTSEAAQALGTWRSDLRKPGHVLLKAIEEKGEWLYAVIYGSLAAVYLFLLTIFIAVVPENSTRGSHVIFVREEAAPLQLRAPAVEEPARPSGLDMEPLLPRPRARHPAPAPEPAPALAPEPEAPAKEDRPDWAAPIALAKESPETKPAAPQHPALQPMSFPREEASKSASGAMLVLPKPEAPREASAPSAASAGPAAAPARAGRPRIAAPRDFRDVNGRVYVH